MGKKNKSDNNAQLRQSRQRREGRGFFFCCCVFLLLLLRFSSPAAPSKRCTPHKEYHSWGGGEGRGDDDLVFGVHCKAQGANKVFIKILL